MSRLFRVSTCWKNSSIRALVQREWSAQGFDGWLMSAVWSSRDSALGLSILWKEASHTLFLFTGSQVRSILISFYFCLTSGPSALPFLLLQAGLHVFDLEEVGGHVRGQDHLNHQRAQFPARHTCSLMVDFGLCTRCIRGADRQGGWVCVWGGLSGFLPFSDLADGICLFPW